MKRYYFLAFANFLAAVGGGIILSAEVGAAFGGGPILAFFVGAVIGLLFHRVVPEQWARSIAPWFSISVACTSIILFGLSRPPAVNMRLALASEFLFFALLSLRFGLWFFSRALRAQVVGSQKQGIALIELGYYMGMALGLLIWEKIDYGMPNPLLFDAMLQSVAGLIDLLAIGKLRRHRSLAPDSERVVQELHPTGRDGKNEAVVKHPFNYQWYWKLAAAVVCLTIGFQAVPFSVAHWEEEQGKYILAYFYIGVALSALACRVFKIKFGWSSSVRKITGNAMISSEKNWIRPSLSFGLITLMATASLLAALSGIRLWGWGLIPMLTFITAASFIYQILVLSLLDQIARAERIAKLNEMVMRTYLLVAVGTIVSIGVLRFFPKSYFICAALTLVCSVAAFSAVRRRDDVHA